ncbi:MAG TPA: hypothetical protein VMI52_07010 [Acetobacteraceae bacterium]|nr:hypothetical protein [Acetobacteraceae bacterium]
MQTYARIRNGAVAELFATDLPITELFFPALLWVDVTARPEVAVGWGYDGSDFVPPAAVAAAAQAVPAATLAVPVAALAATAVPAATLATGAANAPAGAAAMSGTTEFTATTASTASAG